MYQINTKSQILNEMKLSRERKYRHHMFSFWDLYYIHCFSTNTVTGICGSRISVLSFVKKQCLIKVLFSSL